MSATLRKQITVPNICDSACVKKLKTLLSQYFTMREEANPPSNMSLKARLGRLGISREVHLELYTNNNVEIKASAEVRTSFTSICGELETILKEATNILSSQNVFRVMRAGRINDYMKSISVDPEIDRMVIVTLCDIILDLLVSEKLSQFTHDRKELEDESVGAKLALLEKKYKTPVYRPKAIRDVRELRNKIVHGGSSIAKQEAEFARDATIDIFSLF